MTVRKLSRVSGSAMALLALMLVLNTGFAVENPCGSLGFSEGTINVGVSLGLEETLSDDASQCMAYLAKRIKEQKEVRTVTVVARVSNALRTKGVGIRAARSYVKALVAGGVSEYRVSAVSPGTAPGEADVVLLTYTKKTTTKPIAVVVTVYGDVRAGKDKEKLEPVAKGQTLSSYTYISTGDRSGVELTLADGSHIDVDGNTLLLLGRMWLNEKMDREVRINLMKGNFAVDVTKGGTSSNFDVVTPNAIAGVRGTKFRVYYEESGGTRLETIDGTVELKGAHGTVWVKRGQGSSVGSDGTPIRPKPLLLACEPMHPLQGDVSAGAQLRWKPLAGAAKYQVRVARDAEFTTEVHDAFSNQPVFDVGAEITVGKWFWRVIAVDKKGFTGLPSKIYSFVVK